MCVGGCVGRTCGGGAYLSDVHGELVLRLAVLVAERADEGRAVVFGILETSEQCEPDLLVQLVLVLVLMDLTGGPQLHILTVGDASPIRMHPLPQDRRLIEPLNSEETLTKQSLQITALTHTHTHTPPELPFSC